MTRPSNPPGHGRGSRAVAAELLDEQSRRAWTEPMAVKPFGGAYIVDCEDDGTHFVTLGEANCSCGGSEGERRCKHVRRVAIEINLGRVPPPSERSVACQGCGSEVSVSVADDPPHLCPACDAEPGDLVVDREGDPNTPLLVVSPPGHPANEVGIPGAGVTVADYPGNGNYPDGAPVVEAVFPQSVSTDRPPRRYLFPVPRLAKPPAVADGDEPRREALTGGWTGRPD